jgi:hypothetical protein
MERTPMALRSGRAHLDIHDRSSLEAHARLFGVTEGQLRKAIRPAGDRAGASNGHSRR